MSVVRVRLSRTYNLGNYENIKPEFEIEEITPDNLTNSEHLRLLTEELVEEMKYFKETFIPNNLINDWKNC